MSVTIEQITPAAAWEFRDLRLRGLAEHPEAFGEAAEDFAALSEQEIAERIRARSVDGGFILGARDDATGRLVGLTAIAPERGRKSRHRALLWGVYVPAEHGRRGIARRLIEHALERCRRRTPPVEIVLLGVSVTNAPAVALYRSLGFAEYGRDPAAIRVDGIDHDEWLMMRRVGGAADRG
jgi:ribosomal protein S18 acetylase RimI-like enzyme